MSKPSTSLSRGRLVQRLLKKGEELAELLGVSSDEAVVLLRDWSQREIEELWFEDQGEARVRAKVGLGPLGMETAAGSSEPAGCVCELCLETSDQTDTGISWRTPGCESHVACGSCWAAYVRSKVEEGRACGRIRCFGFKCAVPLGVERVVQLLRAGASDAGEAEEVERRFWRFYVDAEVEETFRGKLAFCPSENCEWILERGGRKQQQGEVACGGCSSRYCGECVREVHLPASCAQVEKWTEKNSSESENVKWILAHTKPCPKCTKPIEKNQGCNHMTCSKMAGGCGMEFCWMCGRDWHNHSGGGDVYSCNIYARDPELKNKERTRETSANELNRYLFFFERYNNHMKARSLAGRQLRHIDQKCERIHRHYEASVLDMNFLADALKQIVECRRVLMYTYVYGYFLDPQSNMKSLFEHLQKNLEEKTDKLHEFVEKDLDKEILKLPPFSLPDRKDPIADFDLVTLPPVTTQEKTQVRDDLLLFRSKVSNLLSVVDKFTSAVINDLSRDALGLVTAADRHSLDLH